MNGCKVHESTGHEGISSRTLLALLAIAAALTACGNGLSGTYGKKGDVSFEFHSNGKVELDVIGPVQEATYTVEGDKVKISNPGIGTMVLRIDEKGCLAAAR